MTWIAPFEATVTHPRRQQFTDFIEIGRFMMATSTARGEDSQAEPGIRRTRTDVRNEDIARRAYELYQERGREPEHDMDDWLQAEREVQQSRRSET
jgi:hypothetical protein